MIEKYLDDFYILDDGHVRCFYILGNDENILVDTGFGNEPIINKLKEISDKPIKVILTHGDRDHTGGLYEFKECWIHPGDREMINQNIIIHDLKEQDVIKVGRYVFEVIEIPGHTKGSIGLLDRNKKLFLSGDSVQVGPIYMFGSHRNFDTYLESLKKLMTYKEDIKTIIPSHHTYPINVNYIDYCLKDGLSLKEGKLDGKECRLPCKEYQGQYVSFYY